mgnify:CR=1 FL=1
MPTYSYVCNNVLPRQTDDPPSEHDPEVVCGHVMDVFGVSMSERETPQICEACGGAAEYSFAATMHGARINVAMDENHYLQKKFGRNPNWQPPRSNAGRNDMERVGEERMRAMKGAAEEMLRGGGLTPAQETQAAAMARQPIKSRPKQWTGQEGAKMSYPGQPKS